MKRFAALILLMASTAHAVPNPTSTTGTPGHGNNITVLGSGFGLKQCPDNPNSSLPYWLWDMEDGTQNSVSSLSCGSTQALGDQNMNLVVEARGASTRMMRARTDVNWADFANGGIVATDISMPSASAARSARVYKFVKRKSSRSDYSHTNSDTGALDMDENWKFDRFWVNTNGSGYPNTYTAQNAESGSTCTGGGSRPSPTVEAGSGSNQSQTSSNYRLPGPTWMAEERLLQYNSANGQANGVYKIRQDGQLNINRSNWNTDPSASFPAAGLRRWYTQDDPSNLTFCGGANIDHDVWHDDTVIDYGPYAWARIMLGNASTLADSTVLEYQPEVSLRADGAAVFKQRNGELGTSANKYVYVFDLDDNVNSDGFLLQAGVGNPPPTLDSMTISSGSFIGGDAFTLTGTNLFSGFTIKFGTITATDVSLVGSTTINGSTPPGPPATTVTVTYTGSDAQVGTLAQNFTWSAAPETPIDFDRGPGSDGRFPPFGR